jgi:hypothetical protein
VRLDGGADHIRTGAQPLSVVLTDAAPVSTAAASSRSRSGASRGASSCTRTDQVTSPLVRGRCKINRSGGGPHLKQ